MLSISICWGSCRTWHVSCGTSPDFIYMFEESRSYFAAVPSRNDHQYKIYVINNKLFQQQSTSPMFQVIFGSIMCSVLPVNRNAKIRKGRKPVPTALCCRDLFPVKPLDAIQSCFYTRIYFCKDEFGTFQRCFNITHCAYCLIFFSFLIVHMADVEKLWLETISPWGLWYVS